MAKLAFSVVLSMHYLIPEKVMTFNAEYVEGNAVLRSAIASAVFSLETKVSSATAQFRAFRVCSFVFKSLYLYCE